MDVIRSWSHHLCEIDGQTRTVVRLCMDRELLEMFDQWCQRSLVTGWQYEIIGTISSNPPGGDEILLFIVDLVLADAADLTVISLTYG